jgi:hypothetical protein
VTDKPPVAANNLVNVGAAVQEDYMMSSAMTSDRLDVIYGPAFGETQVNLNVAP